MHNPDLIEFDGRRTSTILEEQVRRARSDDGRLKAYNDLKELNKLRTRIIFFLKLDNGKSSSPAYRLEKIRKIDDESMTSYMM